MTITRPGDLSLDDPHLSISLLDTRIGKGASDKEVKEEIPCCERHCGRYLLRVPLRRLGVASAIVEFTSQSERVVCNITGVKEFYCVHQAVFHSESVQSSEATSRKVPLEVPIEVPVEVPLSKFSMKSLWSVHSSPRTLRTQD